MINEIEITVLKYEIDFTIRKKELKRHSWFSLPNDFLLHPDFLDISGDELKWFIWVVSVCSKKMTSTIRLNIEHGERFLNLNKKSLFSMIEKLKGKQIDTTSEPHQGHGMTTDKDHNGATSEPLHNITLHNNTTIPQSGDCGGDVGLKKVFEAKQLTDKIHEEIENAYKQLFPRKEGKTKGIKKLLKEIKTLEDVGALRLACSNYAKSVAGKDRQYIKHFETFASEWRDWLDPMAGKIQLVKPQAVNGGINRTQKAIEEQEQSNANSSGDPEIVKKALEQAKFLRGQK